MPERRGDTIVYSIALTRRDHERLLAWCQTAQTAPQRLLENLCHDAAIQAGERLEAAALERGRAERHHASPNSRTKAPALAEDTGMKRLLAEARAAQDAAAAERAEEERVRKAREVEAERVRRRQAWAAPAAPKPSPPKAPLAAVTLSVPPRLSVKVPDPRDGRRSYVRVSQHANTIRALNALGYSDLEIAGHLGASSAGVANVRVSMQLPPNRKVKNRPAPPA